MLPCVRFSLLLLLLLPGLVAGQQAVKPPAPAPVVAPAPEPSTHVILLREKLAKRTAKETELLRIRQDLKKETVPESRARLEDSEKTLAQELELLDAELRRSLSGVNDVVLSPDEGDIDLEKQFREVLKPALDFLNDVMKQPREIEELRRGIQRREKEAGILKRAIDGLSKTLAEIDADRDKALNKPLREELTRQRDEYEKKRTIFDNERAVLQRRLDELLAERQGFGHYAARLWSGYVLQRLLNLLLAIASFAGVLFLLRWVRKWLARRGLRKRLGASPFLARATDVVFHILSVTAAIFAAFVVLWISGDWLLLTLAMLLVAGLILVSRHTLPRMYEQARIIMNLGGVREGERVILKGLPWLVRRLHFFSELQNPSLTGGALRLPIRDMASLLSRPQGQKERWFPTEEGDWVELSDGTVGRVVLQTPEVVQVLPVGGSFKSYPTLDFLARNPRNLSHNFRVQTSFSLDFRHAGEVLGEIPELLAAALRQGYLRLVGADDVIHVSVEFAEAGSSSLDLAILSDFNGRAAAHYQALHRLSRRICMETAHANGWTVPFRQVVVHKAAAESEITGAAAGEGIE